MVLEAEAASGKRVPALENRPTLLPFLEGPWRAFQDLCKTRRESGWGPVRLVLSDIEAWFRLHGYTDHELMVEWFQWILALDQCWLRLTQEEKPSGTA